jgi:hypothetical protein
MTTELKPETKFLYRRVLNFLQVLNEEQITKLRNIAIGVRDNTAFSEEEISDLELKYRERSLTIVMRQMQ